MRFQVVGLEKTAFFSRALGCRHHEEQVQACGHHASRNAVIEAELPASPETAATAATTTFS